MVRAPEREPEVGGGVGGSPPLCPLDLMEPILLRDTLGAPSTLGGCFHSPPLLWWILLDTVPPRIHVHLEPQSVTLCRIKIFAGVIKA